VHNTRALSGLEHHTRLGGIPGKGLLAQDVTAPGNRSHREGTVRVRWCRYRDHLRTCTRNRLVQVSECLRYTVALGTSPSAFSVRAYEANHLEPRSTQRGNVNSATEPCANNQCRRLGHVRVHDHPARSEMVRKVYAPFEMVSR